MAVVGAALWVKWKMRGVTPILGDACEPRDSMLSDQRKILAMAKGVKLDECVAHRGVRFTLDGLSGEVVKGNPTTTAIPGLDESKSSPRNNRRLDRTKACH